MQATGPVMVQLIGRCILCRKYFLRRLRTSMMHAPKFVVEAGISLGVMLSKDMSRACPVAKVKLKMRVNRTKAYTESTGRCDAGAAEGAKA